MEFNISYKVDSETGKANINVVGDKVFAEKLTKFIEDVQEMFQIIPSIASKKLSSPLNMIEPMETELYVEKESATIKADNILAELIFSMNPDLIDKIVIIKDSDSKTIGLRFK